MPEVRTSVKRDLLQQQKRLDPALLVYLRSAQMSKEAYLHGKRGLFIWQKRPIYMEVEALILQDSLARRSEVGVSVKETF